MSEYNKVIQIEPQHDQFDDVRMEYAQMLKQQLAKGNNGLVRTKYITFSIEAKSVKEAKPRLERIETDILNNFKVLGVKAYPLNGVERLQIMYEMFHQEEERKFEFSYDRILQSGMTTKDFIAPTSFLFKSGKDFQMGDTIGAVSYLNILAPELTDLQTNPMKIEKFGNLDDAMSCYQQIPNFHLKALGVEKTPDPLPGSLDIVQCKNGIDTIVEDYKKVPGWDNPYIQNHVAALVAEALKVQDVAVAYKIKDGYFYIQISEDGYDYTLYNKDFTVMDGGIVETDEYRPVQEVMEEVLAEHGHSISECGVISAEYLQEQSYRAETQRAEAMKEKLAAEKPAPEASISFYVAECAEFPVMGEFHDNLTLEQALEVYDKIPAERMSGIKSIGFSLEDGSIYSGMFDLVVGGEVQAEIVNHIQHYRESPLVQKAISDMKTLLEKRQASKELEERPNTRQSVREALKNRKKAQEQQSNQEQAKPKKAKKKGEMEL